MRSKLARSNEEHLDADDCVSEARIDYRRNPNGGSNVREESNRRKAGYFEGRRWFLWSQLAL